MEGSSKKEGLMEFWGNSVVTAVRVGVEVEEGIKSINYNGKMQ